MSSPTPCADPDRLKALLDGTLFDQEETELNAHVETCEQCQETLESLVAGKESWSEVARHLSHEEASALAQPSRNGCAADDVGSADTMRVVHQELSLDFLAPPAKPEQLGRLNHYDVLEVIGRGGMGVVLKAFDPKLQRVVAIKVMAPHLATSAAARDRFIREARGAAAVRNEHVINIHDVNDLNNPPYLVMEYIDGVSLQERLDRRGPLEVKEILRIGMQAATGLAAAHAQGLVHRDIKPANILLENGVERVKLTDFGLARAADDASITQSGVIAGTPQYMAPEQARGEPVDHRADLFSLGSVLYAMCTGRQPFRASGAMAVLKRVCEDKPRPIRDINPEIPDWLADLIATLQAKEPAERLVSAAEVAELLSQHLAHLQQPALVPAPQRRAARRQPDVSARRRRWRWVAVLGAALVLGTVSFFAVPDIIIRIRGKDGQAIEIKVPDGSEIKIEKNGKVVASVPPAAKRAGEIRRFEGHEGRVSSVALSPDGRYALSGGWDEQIVRLWDLKTGKELAPFEGHTDSINSVTFSSDGRFALSGSKDLTMRLWEVESRKQVQVFEGHTSVVWSVALSRDGSRALSCGTKDKSVRLWDTKTGKELQTFEGHTLRACSVAFSSDAKRVLSGGWDKIMLLWDVDSGKELQRFEGHADHVESVAFSPDDRHALSGGRDGVVRLWDVQTGQLLRSFRGHRGWVNSVAFSPDGRRALSGGTDRSMLLWDVETAKILQAFEGHVDAVSCVAFSRDGRFAISGGDLRDRSVRVWQLPPTPEKEAAKKQ